MCAQIIDFAKSLPARARLPAKLQPASRQPVLLTLQYVSSQQPVHRGWDDRVRIHLTQLDSNVSSKKSKKISPSIRAPNFRLRLSEVRVTPRSETNPPERCARGQRRSILPKPYAARRGRADLANCKKG